MKIVKYIQNDDENFYEDIKDKLLNKGIEFHKLEISKYPFLPKFLENYFQSKQINKNKNFKISSAPYKNLDIFLHKGRLDSKNIEAIKSAKQIIVNSYTQRTLIENKLGRIDNISIIYPFIKIEKRDKKILKQLVFEDINISNPDEHIILFNAKNFKTNGIKEFMDIISALSQRNFVALIVGDKEQIDKSKFLIESYQEQKQHIYFIDIQNKAYSLDDIYTIADIFILPTKRTLFSLNLLKAMAYKTVVMIPSTNGASEIVDAFSIMQGVNDTNTAFKLDALLQRKSDLKLIQKTNKKIAKDFTKKRYIKSIIDVINSLN